MNYIALYRKWRPTKFDDVVGQEHITTTLKNQISYQRIAHAYLFSGTRGTGKTSTAKIFAKAVNCSQPIEGNPCEKCEVCRGMDHANTMDIIEIDAASNNGVDEIRDLREKVKYPPSLGKYKVYIIDEVHMLSPGAFNALLKTLEEPPKHVIFILATTELHKIPATILSRCQRFDFKRVTIEDMVKRMDYICKEMNISIEKRALELIAKNAEGAMRDALSILDQCLALGAGDGPILYETIVDTLGLAPQGWVYTMGESIIKQDIQETLTRFHQMVDGGKNLLLIAKQLTEHFRNLLIVKTTRHPEAILEISQEHMDTLKEQSKEVMEERIFRFIGSLSEVEYKMKYSNQSMILLEMELIKLCKEPLGENMEDVLERLKLLEEKIGKGVMPQSKTPTIESRISSTEKAPSKTKVQDTPLYQKEEKVSQEKKEKAPQEKKLEGNADLTIEHIQDNWKNILQNVKRQKVQVGALLKEGQPMLLDKGMLIIAFQEGFGFHQSALAKEENTQLLRQVISETMGASIGVKCVMEDDMPSSNQKAQEDVVHKAIEIFGKDIVEVVEED